VRDYLRAASVEFDDRNIRQSDAARAELMELTGDLAVPTLMYGEQRVTGFDPEGIDHVVAAYRADTRS
jgi:glutaredoxin